MDDILQSYTAMTGPEDVQLCEACKRSLYVGGVETTIVLDIPTLCKSSRSCALCKVFLGCVEDRAREVRDRFVQYTVDMVHHFPLHLTSRANENDIATEARTVDVTIDFTLPNNFNYPSNFILRVVEPRTNPVSLAPIWSSFPTSAEEKLSTMKSWWKHCEHSHPWCKSDQCNTQPSRLIELSTTRPQEARLILSSDAGQPPIRYTCLSYCWGLENNVKTTTSNKDSMHKMISVGDLPQTYLDAFAITRQLGLRYIWIDALCIIQDDDEDWQREASSMAGIYSGSALTLIASEADTSDGGFFQQRRNTMANRSAYDRVFLRTAATSEEPELCFHVIPRRPRRTALNKRGWALQEAILPARTVQIFDSELHWRCWSERFRETGIASNQSDAIGGTPPVPFDRTHSNVNKFWHAWIVNYSNRVFTRPKDCVAAIAGLVEWYSRLTQDESLLGLWRSTIQKDLQWMRDVDKAVSYQTGSYPFGLPSWSPLCKGIVSYHFEREDYWTVLRETVLEVIECSSSWSGLPFVSKLLSSSLVVRGYLKEIMLSEVTDLPDCIPRYFDVEDEGPDPNSRGIPWRCQLQWDSDVWRPAQSWPCLLLEQRDPKGYAIAGEIFLVLEPVPDFTGVQTFRRIGIGALGRRRQKNRLEEYRCIFDTRRRSTIRLV